MPMIVIIFQVNVLTDLSENPDCFVKLVVNTITKNPLLHNPYGFVVFIVYLKTLRESKNSTPNVSKSKILHDTYVKLIKLK